MLAVIQWYLICFIVGLFVAKTALPDGPALARLAFAADVGLLLLLAADLALFCLRARQGRSS